MNFRKTSKGEGKVGVIFNPKNYVADFGFLYRFFSDVFENNLQHNFPKMRGGGQWPFGIFSENSSVLVA